MAQAHEILDYVKEALIDSTMQNTFMDDATKARAKAKVHCKIIIMYGYAVFRLAFLLCGRSPPRQRLLSLTFHNLKCVKRWLYF